jgi:hypothetical protein
MKAGVCVSTVGIVSVCRADFSAQTRTGITGYGAGCGDTAPMVADDADGADNIFLSCTYANDPASGSAFATEGNVDT